MELENLYNLDYKSLTTFLIQYKDVAKEFLKDKKLKEKLINPINKYEFIWFVQEKDNDLLPYLLDEDGIKILESTDFFEEKMDGLLTSFNPSLEFLFKNNSFNELIIINLKKVMYYLISLDTNSALNLMNYIKNYKDKEILNRVALFFNEKTTLSIIKKFDLSIETKLKIIKKYKTPSEYLLNKDPSITTLSIFSISTLYNIAKKNIKITNALLTEKDFLKQITTTPHTKEYRFIINELSKSNDISHIEEKRKKYYDQQLKDYIREEKMLKNYLECYTYISELNPENDEVYEKIRNNLKFYLNMDDSVNEFHIVADTIYKLLKEKNIDKLKEFFQKESSIQLSNMIIDYHFEEISYNLFINIKQLLKFQEMDKTVLSSADINIYTKLLNLDTLSYEEKLSLHLALKKENFIEKHYDDIRNAKNRSIELIKEKMLTKKNIKKYKDESLSKKYGVDIYVLDKDPFFVLVKSLGKGKSSALEKYDIQYRVDGASYSLDSSAKLNTFLAPQDNYNIAYTNFETDQIVHIYPVDSFSNYDRNIKATGTDRVFELHTPESICDEYEQYNEILIAQKNERKTDELNSTLKNPEMFALYCYDTILDVDIISAHNLGIGIILVKTKAYEIKTNVQKKSMYDTMFLNDGYQHGITYLDKFTQDDKYNRR